MAKKKVPYPAGHLPYNDFKSIKLCEKAVEQLLHKYRKFKTSTVLVTFTFELPVYNPKKANSLFRSLNLDLKARFLDYIKVVHQHRKGKVHFHLVAVVKSRKDLASGFSRTPKRANSELRKERAYWRKVLTSKTTKWRGVKQRVWGKFQLEPVAKFEALAFYLTKSVILRLRVNLKALTRKRPKVWVKSKLWTHSKGIKIRWKDSFRGTAFTDAMNFLIRINNLTSEAQLKRRLGRYWAYEVLREMWKKPSKREKERIKRLVEREVRKVAARKKSSKSKTRTLLDEFDEGWKGIMKRIPPGIPDFSPGSSLKN